MTIQKLLEKYGEQQDDSMIFALLYLVQSRLSLSDDELEDIVIQSELLTSLTENWSVVDTVTHTEVVTIVKT